MTIQCGTVQCVGIYLAAYYLGSGPPFYIPGKKWWPTESITSTSPQPHFRKNGGSHFCGSGAEDETTT